MVTPLREAALDMVASTMLDASTNSFNLRSNSGVKPVKGGSENGQHQHGVGSSEQLH
jgi:hypothetical protein